MHSPVMIDVKEISSSGPWKCSVEECKHLRVGTEMFFISVYVFIAKDKILYCWTYLAGV